MAAIHVRFGELPCQVREGNAWLDEATPQRQTLPLHLPFEFPFPASIFTLLPLTSRLDSGLAIPSVICYHAFC